MKKNSVVMFSKVERRVTDPAPVFHIRNPNPRPMATRLDTPKPVEVTPVAPVQVEYPRTEPLMDLRDVAIRINTTARHVVRALVIVAAMLVAVALWSAWQ
jgi:hypothetical protein